MKVYAIFHLFAADEHKSRQLLFGVYVHTCVCVCVCVCRVSVCAHACMYVLFGAHACALLVCLNMYHFWIVCVRVCVCLRAIVPFLARLRVFHLCTKYSHHTYDINTCFVEYV